MSKITEKDVEYIAGLSRIHLQKEEVAALQKDLEGILHYVAKLEKLDTAKVQPTTHVLPLQNVYREDKPRPSLKQEEVLKISVDKHNGSFKVPRVIE